MEMVTLLFVGLTLIASIIAADQLGYNRGVQENIDGLLRTAYEDGLEDGKQEKIVEMKGGK